MGTIYGLEIRNALDKKTNETYSYLDIMIKSGDVEIRGQYSAKINQYTELGKLIVRFGFDPQMFGKTEVNLDDMLLGRKVQFATITNESTKGDGKHYSNVVSASVSPVQ